MDKQGAFHRLHGTQLAGGGTGGLGEDCKGCLTALVSIPDPLKKAWRKNMLLNRRRMGTRGFIRAIKKEKEGAWERRTKQRNTREKKEGPGLQS